MRGQCLDKQTGRCTDRQASAWWSVKDCAFRCHRCGGITKTEEELHDHDTANGGIE